MAKETTAGAVTATARPLRPEDAPWNRWPTGGHRLFNNRAALLFEVSIRSDEPLVWLPAGTTLELNDEHTVVPAAETTEALLADLLSHAFLEEQWSIPGDLVDRARGAGPFRAAYLPLHAQDGAMEGIMAFPLWAGPGRSLAELHVVAVRLTVKVGMGSEEEADLVWVFD
ncbi:MAG: hypothetical protein KTR31_20330 [Myxococcales bacterium]|nr:hypothetical protein [Myxococcales bacterium]